MRRAALALALLLVACVSREAPYRFHAPLVAGVSVSEPARAVAAGEPGGHPIQLASIGPAGTLGLAGPERGPLPAEVDAALRVVPPSGWPLSEVGARTDETPAAYVLRVLSGLGVVLPDPATVDGPALVAEARARGALDPALPAQAGDVVVFEDGQLLGIVTSVREDGAVEFVFARDRVVRRGLVHPGRRDARRDQHGRALNTFVRRYSPSDPPTQRYLSGDLLTGFIRP